jgi:hypothetical protein
MALSAFFPSFLAIEPYKITSFSNFFISLVGEISQVKKRVGVNLKLPYWPNSVHTGEWSCVAKGHCRYERVRVRSCPLRFRKLDDGGRVL